MKTLLLESHLAEVFCEKNSAEYKPPDISIPRLHNNLYSKCDHVEGCILNVIHKMYYHVFWDRSVEVPSLPKKSLDNERRWRTSTLKLQEMLWCAILLGKKMEEPLISKIYQEQSLWFPKFLCSKARDLIFDINVLKSPS